MRARNRAQFLRGISRGGEEAHASRQQLVDALLRRRRAEPKEIDSRGRRRRSLRLARAGSIWAAGVGRPREDIVTPAARLRMRDRIINSRDRMHLARTSRRGKRASFAPRNCAGDARGRGRPPVGGNDRRAHGGSRRPIERPAISSRVNRGIVRRARLIFSG